MTLPWSTPDSVVASCAVLDRVQVSEVHATKQTAAVTDQSPIHIWDWTSSRGRSDIIIAALGGVVAPDAATQDAFASVMRDHCRELSDVQWHDGSLPDGI
jgi:hypothetical protein